MKALLKNIPVLLFAALEIIIGVMLFKDPSGVTEIVLLIIGVALALIGAYNLIRALVARNNGEEGAFAALVIGLLLLAAGLFFALGRKLILGAIPFIAVIYGIFLIISGLYKFKTWLEIRKLSGTGRSLLLLLGAVISVGLGAVIILNPCGATEFAFKFAAVALIAEALLDIIGVVISSIRPAEQS